MFCFMHDLYSGSIIFLQYTGSPTGIHRHHSIQKVGWNCVKTAWQKTGRPTGIFRHHSILKEGCWRYKFICSYFFCDNHYFDFIPNLNQIYTQEYISDGWQTNSNIWTRLGSNEPEVLWLEYNDMQQCIFHAIFLAKHCQIRNTIQNYWICLISIGWCLLAFSNM